MNIDIPVLWEDEIQPVAVGDYLISDLLVMEVCGSYVITHLEGTASVVDLELIRQKYGLNIAGVENGKFLFQYDPIYIPRKELV